MNHQKLPVKRLEGEGFARYGAYARVIPASARALGPAPIQFMPDLLRMSCDGRVGFSVNRLAKRTFAITALECHDRAQEAILPLDGDVLVHLAPPTRKSAVPVDEIEVFLVPRGTMLLIEPGVWHHAPFPVGEGDCHVLVVLPERTYENDCFVHRLAPEDAIGIDFPEAVSG